MMVVGVLTLVVSGRGSMELGGLNSAAVGLGTAMMGPLIGAAADRFGQRRVLLVAGTVNSASLAVLSWLVFSPLPDWAMLVTSFLVGASAPQISPMSRTRLVSLVRDRLPAARKDRVLNAVMATESTADELVFVFGPFIVGVLAVTMGAAAPVIGASILTLIFVTAFALHHTAQPAQTKEQRAATLAPASELVRPALLVVVAGIFGVGLFFGSMLTSLTAFMQALGAEERAGLIYGVLGIGSAIFALAVVLFSPRFTLRARWLLFALLMLAGALLLQRATSEFDIVVAIAIIGCGIGPVLVTLYSLGSDRSPAGRSATVMTMLGSAITVGQSIASALTGILSERLGASVAFVMPLAATVVVVITGLVNWPLSPSVRSRTASAEHTPSAG